MPKLALYSEKIVISDAKSEFFGPKCPKTERIPHRIFALALQKLPSDPLATPPATVIPDTTELSALPNDPLDAIRIARIRHSVQNYVTDGDLTLTALASGLVIDHIGQFFNVFFTQTILLLLPKRAGHIQTLIQQPKENEMKCLSWLMSRKTKDHQIDTPPQKEYIAPMKITNHLLDDPKVDTSIQSPNVSKGTITPEIIVLHYTASGGEDGKGDAQYLSRAASRASAHIVAGRPGDLHQIVPFNRRAWHAGRSEYEGRKNVNSFSIGIEIDNWGWLNSNHESHTGTKVPSEHVFTGTRGPYKKWEKYRPEQLDAVEEVIAAICEAYDIKDIVGHEDIAPGRKQDPGPALDAFTARMKEKYLGKPKTSTPSPSKTAPSKGTAKVKADGLRLRERPNYTAKILTHLYTGYTVEVLQENVFPGWDKIKYKNKVGFVASRYLTK